VEIFGACLLFLTLEINHCPFKCQEPSCLAVGSGLAVRLAKVEVGTARGGSMKDRFSALVVSVSSAFTLEEVTYETCVVFLCMKKCNHS